MKRFLCIAILGAFALAPPIATPDPPPDNIGAVIHIYVFGLGVKGNGAVTTGVRPQAHVYAAVHADAIPSACVTPQHVTPNDVTLGKDEYADYTGKASGTVTRAHLNSSTSSVVTEPDKSKIDEHVYLLIRRKESVWKSVATGVAAGAATAYALDRATKFKMPHAGRIAVYASLTTLKGTLAPLFWKEIWNEVDARVCFTLYHDPVPGYRVRWQRQTWLGREYYWITWPFQVIDSTAKVRGEWTNTDPHSFGNSGDTPVYQHAHSHPTFNGAYGALHTDW